MGPAFAWAMAGTASAHQAETAISKETSTQRAGRRRRSSADPQRTQQGATATAASAPAALDSLSRLRQLAVTSPQVAQLRRLQALADDHYAPVSQLAGAPEEKERVQDQFATAELPPQLQQAPSTNNTGLPDQLKSGIESLSGLSMDHVRVHYNSAQPEQVNALAYAQGSDIHLAPGQEHQLPHETWHVVQQAQGRVRPTLQMKDGAQVNDDTGLEREADVMGTKALEGGQRVVGSHLHLHPIEIAQKTEGGTTNSPNVSVASNHSAPLANGRGSAQRGGNAIQRIADRRPEAAFQRQVQAWGGGSERVGQLRAWQGVADGRGVGGERQDLSPGLQTASADQARVLGMERSESSGSRVLQAMFYEWNPQGASDETKYIWHWGPVIPWIWKPKQDRGEKQEIYRRYGVWERKVNPEEVREGFEQVQRVAQSMKAANDQLGEKLSLLQNQVGTRGEIFENLKQAQNISERYVKELGNALKNYAVATVVAVPLVVGAAAVAEHFLSLPAVPMAVKAAIDLAGVLYGGYVTYRWMQTEVLPVLARAALAGGNTIIWARTIYGLVSEALNGQWFCTVHVAALPLAITIELVLRRILQSVERAVQRDNRDNLNYQTSSMV